MIEPGWRQLPSWRNCSWLSPDLWQWIHVAWGHPSHHHHCHHCLHQHTSRYLNNCVATALSFFKTLSSCLDSYFGKITQSSVPLCLCWEYLKQGVGLGALWRGWGSHQQRRLSWGGCKQIDMVEIMNMIMSQDQQDIDVTLWWWHNLWIVHILLILL